MSVELVDFANSTDTDITEAVSLLKKHGFGAIAISTSIGSSSGTKIVIELRIDGTPRESCLKKAMFENAWLTFN